MTKERRAYELASLSPHTRETYARYWGAFSKHCAGKGLESLPADGLTVAEYIDERAASDRLSTIKARVCAIRKEHVLNGHDDPTKTDHARRALADAARSLGEAQSQAVGLTAEMLRRMRARISSERDRVNYALAYVMRDGLLRRAEAAALTWGDIDEWTDGSGRLHVRRSKTDQTGRGHTRYLSCAAMDALRAVRPLAYADDQRVFPFSGRTVARRLNEVGRSAGCDRPLSGHSCRVGMAQDLAASGADAVAIAQAGGWSSTTQVLGYTRMQQAGRGAVAKYHGEAA